jgi:uncharacterized protein
VAALKLRIVPNAKRNEIAGEYGDAVKVKVAAPAVDGKANAALLEFLAAKLDVPVRAVMLVAGEKSRDKLVAVEGVVPEEVRRRLLE